MALKHFWFICFVITNINIATQKFVSLYNIAKLYYSIWAEAC